MGIVGIVLLTAGAAYFVVNRQADEPIPIACTEEAKLCPDGSAVGRTGPNCEFASCPEVNPIPTPGEGEVSLREGQRDGSLLVEKIYPDHITGLNFPEYPVGGGPGYPITLRVGEVASNGCTRTLTLIRIQGDTATFTKKIDLNRPCPICLAEHTLIDAPSGAVAVQDLERGMAVWTISATGDRVEAIVLETFKTPVPVTHHVIHIVLEDSRELFVSPGHPTVDGRAIGELSAGDVLDGGKVTSAISISYREGYTYDMLPSGETGFYWANGILIASTLQ